MNEASTHAAAGFDTDLLLARAKFASIATLVALGFFAVVLLGELGELAGFINLNTVELGTAEVIYSFILIASSVTFLVSAVAISMWIYRAHSSLREAGRDDLEYTPGWAVGWFFVPIMNLFKPLGAMRELWNESHLTADSYGSESPGNLGQWWGAWIIGGILSNVSTRLTLMADGSGNMQIAVLLSVASSVFLIAAALLIYQIIGTITQALISNVNAASVFE